ncbi:hypothetical protein AX15_007414 [Amanita polypyramis BW_CC]|nr:hypothetical protein AX15_007414 [Amanita polypyramis BW_CC]
MSHLDVDARFMQTVGAHNAYIQDETRFSISILSDPLSTPTLLSPRSVSTPDSSSREHSGTTTIGGEDRSEFSYNAQFLLELKVVRLELEIVKMLNAQLETELEKARRAQEKAENMVDEVHRARAQAEHGKEEAVRARLDAEDRLKQAIDAQREAETQAEEASRAKVEAEGKAQEATKANLETERRAAQALQEAEKANRAQVEVEQELRLVKRETEKTGLVVPKVKPVSDGALTVLDRHRTRCVNRSFHIWRPVDSRIFPITKSFAEMHAYVAIRENNFTMQRLLRGSTSIAVGAGLNILSVMCSMNNGFIAIHGLPLDVRENEVEGLFADLDTRFCILDTRQCGDGTISATAVVEAVRKQAVANRLNGGVVRNKVIGANVVDDFSLPGAPPYILSITWEFPSRGALRTTISDFYLQEFYVSLRRELESSVGLLSLEFTSYSSKCIRNAATVCFGTWSSAKKVHDMLAGKKLKPHFPVMRCSLRPNEPKTSYILCIPLELRNNHESGSITRSARSTAISGTASVAKTVEYHYLYSGWFDGWDWSSDLKTVEFFEYNLARKDLGILMIKRDWMKKTLSFHATTQGAMELVSDEIDKFVRRSSLGVYAIEIDRRLVGSFNGSARLEMLRQRLGDDAVWLDVECSTPILKYRGYRSFNLVKRLVDEIQGGNSQFEEQKKAECLVCRHEAGRFVELNCGHKYCVPCLKRYFLSAPARDLFPITCVGDDRQCQRLITIPIMQSILSPVEFDELVEAAAALYLIQHRDRYKYCVTTTCMQIYRDDAGNPQTLTCPSCSVSFCSACRSKAHGNMLCPSLPVSRTPSPPG